MRKMRFFIALFVLIDLTRISDSTESRWGDRCIPPAPRRIGEGWARLFSPSHGSFVSCNVETRFELHFEGNISSVSIIWDGNRMGTVRLMDGLRMTVFIDIEKVPGPTRHVAELESESGFLIDRAEFLLEFAEVEPLGCSRSASILDPDLHPDWFLFRDHSAYGEEERRIFSQVLLPLYRAPASECKPCCVHAHHTDIRACRTGRTACCSRCCGRWAAAVAGAASSWRSGQGTGPSATAGSSESPAGPGLPLTRPVP
jgi:hypothetical protein